MQGETVGDITNEFLESIVKLNEVLKKIDIKGALDIAARLSLNGDSSYAARGLLIGQKVIQNPEYAKKFAYAIDDLDNRLIDFVNGAEALECLIDTAMPDWDGFDQCQDLISTIISDRDIEADGDEGQGRRKGETE